LETTERKRLVRFCLLEEEGKKEKEKGNKGEGREENPPFFPLGFYDNSTLGRLSLEGGIKRGGKKGNVQKLPSKTSQKGGGGGGGGNRWEEERGKEDVPSPIQSLPHKSRNGGKRGEEKGVGEGEKHRRIIARLIFG